jgi:hypothetical protein
MQSTKAFGKKSETFSTFNPTHLALLFWVYTKLKINKPWCIPAVQFASAAIATKAFLTRPASLF